LLIIGWGNVDLLIDVVDVPTTIEHVQHIGCVGLSEGFVCDKNGLGLLFREVRFRKVVFIFGVLTSLVVLGCFREDIESILSQR
jgi:hypothetical protein